MFLKTKKGNDKSKFESKSGGDKKNEKIMFRLFNTMNAKAIGTLLKSVRTKNKKIRFLVLPHGMM